MQVIEVLALEQFTGLFEKIAKILPLNRIHGYQIPVWRLEIDPDLVVLIYQFDLAHEVPLFLLDNIFPHIKSVVALSTKENFGEWKFPSGVDERLNDLSGKAAVVLAIADAENSLFEYIVNNGLYLGKKGRMVFWNPVDRESIKRVWKMVLSDLMIVP